MTAILCLGIESTAHTFACAIIDSSGKILSDRRDVFRPPEGSGIHPRDASRHHSEVAPELVHSAFESAGLRPADIDVIGYSAGPGLGPCLRIGAVAARTMSGFYKKPLVAVNHAIGHIELGLLLTGAKDPLVLLVSGGHTMILVFAKNRWRVFGETLDTTLGQLLDQFGRSLGYSSPCGNKIEALAASSVSSGKYLMLPYSVKGNDVSFSGLLTAAKALCKAQKEQASDVAHSLQETAFAMVAETIERAISFTGKREVLIVGGVAANKRLAEMLKEACNRHDCQALICPPYYAGDNGVQIACTALKSYEKTGRSIRASDSFVKQSWRLDSVDVTWHCP